MAVRKVEPTGVNWGLLGYVDCYQSERIVRCIHVSNACEILQSSYVISVDAASEIDRKLR